MITQIQIQNFKSLQDITVNCQNLNILTGINGMGKSSLIQTLLLLRQSYMKGYSMGNDKYLYLGEENNDRDLVVIGDYEDAIYRDYEDEKAFIQFDISLSNDKQLRIKTEKYNTKNSLSNIINIEMLHSALYEDIVEEVLFKKRRFQYLQADRVAYENQLPTDNKRLAEKDFGKDGRYATNYFLANANNNIPIAALAFPETEVFLLSYQMNEWLSYISPNLKVASKYNDTNPSIIDQQYSFSTDGIPRKPFKASNVGFGISYTFAVILALLTAEKGDLIIIENPESHLHPKGQSKLAELMCLAAQAGVQIFCETHSDHIINGVRVAIVDKKNTIEIEKIKIFYFFKDENDFATKVEEVKIDNQAKLQYSEKTRGFFDQIQIDLKKIRNA
jgi:predicted ATPase